MHVWTSSRTGSVLYSRCVWVGSGSLDKNQCARASVIAGREFQTAFIRRFPHLRESDGDELFYSISVDITKSNARTAHFTRIRPGYPDCDRQPDSVLHAVLPSRECKNSFAAERCAHLNNRLFAAIICFPDAKSFNSQARRIRAPFSSPRDLMTG